MATRTAHGACFLTSQPDDADVQATIARLFAPVGPITVVEQHQVDEFPI